MVGNTYAQLGFISCPSIRSSNQKPPTARQEDTLLGSLYCHVDYHGRPNSHAMVLGIQEYVLHRYPFRKKKKGSMFSFSWHLTPILGSATNLTRRSRNQIIKHKTTSERRFRSWITQSREKTHSSPGIRLFCLLSTFLKLVGTKRTHLFLISIVHNKFGFTATRWSLITKSTREDSSRRKNPTRN